MPNKLLPTGYELHVQLDDPHIDEMVTIVPEMGSPESGDWIALVRSVGDPGPTVRAALGLPADAKHYGSVCAAGLDSPQAALLNLARVLRVIADKAETAARGMK